MLPSENDKVRFKNNIIARDIIVAQFERLPKINEEVIFKRHTSCVYVIFCRVIFNVK